jgi:Tol biopolymer transport system component
MISRLLSLVLVLFAATASDAAQNTAPAPVTVTMNEGTSMSVSVSPDGRMLAMDLQGSIWVVPATGGEARRITDLFNDARQPVWSPDGKTIAFFAYRDGGYDLWAVAPDGSGQHQLTWGAFDDRDPAFSHDGTRIAFSSDRGNPLGSDTNIFVLDLRSGRNPPAHLASRRRHHAQLVAGRPPDILCLDPRVRPGVFVVDAAGGEERRLAQTSARIDAASWGPGGQVVAHGVEGVKGWLQIDGKPLTGDEHVLSLPAQFRVGHGIFLWRRRQDQKARPERRSSDHSLYRES